MKKHPPFLAEQLLKLLTINEDIEERLGDFEEEYIKIHQSKNKFQADVWYWKQLFNALPSFTWSTFCWLIAYMKMNFITGIRMIKFYIF